MSSSSGSEGLSAIARSDSDAVLPVAIGTVAWAIALVVMLVLREQLRDAGNEWWIAVAATAVGLGVIGLVFLVLRRRHRARPHGQL